jgi:hypothetical protein
MQELLERGDDITRQIASSYLRFRQDYDAVYTRSGTAFTNAPSYSSTSPKGDRARGVDALIIICPRLLTAPDGW